MEKPRLLLLGNPLLRKISNEVTDFSSNALKSQAKSLHEILVQFRQEHGFGRGIAAPQLGILERVIALNLDGRQTTLVNPEIIWQSPEEFSLWDDCMCFPDLLVRVKRHSSISVRFFDEQGQTQLWEKLPQDRAELLQHEIDHLNGILAIDRAIDRESISYRSNVI